MKKIILALAITGLSFTSAFAEELDFAKIDTDGDGLVSIEETQAAGLPLTLELFSEADKDQDGKLNAEELASTVKQ
ncbi:MAG: calmodulin [Hyphomicrobiales bacterium]|nr:hypothetical protein [Hyphomicrobiales bacterium]PCH50136.1 MAG: calmodulin [Hyphomicrobiales bacterium]